MTTNPDNLGATQMEVDEKERAYNRSQQEQQAFIQIKDVTPIQWIFKPDPELHEVLIGRGLTKELKLVISSELFDMNFPFLVALQGAVNSRNRGAETNVAYAYHLGKVSEVQGIGGNKVRLVRNCLIYSCEEMEYHRQIRRLRLRKLQATWTNTGIL